VVVDAGEVATAAEAMTKVKKVAAAVTKIT